jgi:hypothetical protein
MSLLFYLSVRNITDIYVERMQTALRITSLRAESEAKICPLSQMTDLLVTRLHQLFP